MLGDGGGSFSTVGLMASDSLQIERVVWWSGRRGPPLGARTIGAQAVADAVALKARRGFAMSVPFDVGNLGGSGLAGLVAGIDE